MKHGYIPDAPHMRALYTRWAHRFGLISSPPPRDLRSFAPHVLDQGSCSGCVGHGTATGIATAAAAAGAPLGFVPSPNGIYTNALALDRGDPLSGPLQDQGCMPSSAMRGLTEFGIRALVPSGALTDVSQTGTTIAEPDLGALELEGSHLYVGWYAVMNADEARSAIAAGAPVGIGTYVDSRFEQWTPSRPPLGSMDQNDPRGGGHWTALLGFDASRFYLRNSWGESWGSGGDAYVTDDFVNQADQLIAFGWKGASK